ncbi:MAG: hypothetical protein NC120_13530 [Ruminococcus sp.]|nr:hypothetical protein [Ruminococcus sp.]
MSLINELQSLGCNTEEALARFMNNSALYEKMLGKLPPQIKTLEVMPFIELGDITKATENAHTLKGITGNLSVTPLYDAYNEIVAALRAGDSEKAKSKLQEILSVQEQIVSCIEHKQ